MIPEPVQKGLKYLLIGAVIVFIAFFGYLVFLFNEAPSGSGVHHFHYTITLSHPSTIDNVTILLPVPLLDGTPVLAESFLNRTVSGAPPGWNLSLEVVNGTPLLAIRAATMVPEYHGYPIAIEPGESPLPPTRAPGKEYSADTPVLVPVSLGTIFPVNRTIDTRNPVGKEPLFSPGGEFRLEEEYTLPYARGRAFGHTVPVYVSFSAGSPVALSITTSIEGTNAVWKGGWVSHSYTDTVSVEVTEPGGWIGARGILVVEE
ncbi:MAG TPA: hypothetical protein P5029_08140 [Methanolinea sp.]|nr:hypothetical protein [Methanolinea sp.]HRS93491.1 hypothetical protein [Methanolinea sp.]HRU80557.1 hypothetical protein [Methanolinea sp.]